MKKRELKRKQEKENKAPSPKIEELTDEEAMKMQADIDKRQEKESKETSSENAAEKDTKLVVCRNCYFLFRSIVSKSH